MPSQEDITHQQDLLAAYRRTLAQYERLLKPGRRVYSGSTELPRIRNGLGTVIVSTPRGVLSDAEAREANVGGEVLAEVFC